MISKRNEVHVAIRVVTKIWIHCLRPFARLVIRPSSPLFLVFATADIISIDDNDEDRGGANDPTDNDHHHDSCQDDDDDHEYDDDVVAMTDTSGIDHCITLQGLLFWHFWKPDYLDISENQAI